MKTYQDINKKTFTDGLRKAGNGGKQLHMILKHILQQNQLNYRNI